jgi:hypothetical protein
MDGAEAVVEAVAAEYDLDPTTLRGALEDLQALVAGHAEVGGVDGLVYEWRRAYPQDPLLERTPDRYYLAVEERVWTDFSDRLAFEDRVAAATRAVHARVLDAATDGGPGPGVPLVLDR